MTPRISWVAPDRTTLLREGEPGDYVISIIGSFFFVTATP
jgi:hypothetical protein